MHQISLSPRGYLFPRVPCTALAGLSEGCFVLPALHFAQFFAPAPSGCEMSPLSTGDARSHSLNADVEEPGSGQKAENHPQPPADSWGQRCHCCGSHPCHLPHWAVSVSWGSCIQPPQQDAAAGHLLSTLLSFKVLEKKKKKKSKYSLLPLFLSWPELSL